MNRCEDNDRRYQRAKESCAQKGELNVGVQLNDPNHRYVNPGLIAPLMKNAQNLTQRELFAGLALCGLLAQGDNYGVEYRAVEHADKLMKELEAAQWPKP